MVHKGSIHEIQVLVPVITGDVMTTRPDMVTNVVPNRGVQRWQGIAGDAGLSIEFIDRSDS